MLNWLETELNTTKKPSLYINIKWYTQKVISLVVQWQRGRRSSGIYFYLLLNSICKEIFMESWSWKELNLGNHLRKTLWLLANKTHFQFHSKAGSRFSYKRRKVTYYTTVSPRMQEKNISLKIFFWWGNQG